MGRNAKLRLLAPVATALALMGVAGGSLAASRISSLGNGPKMRPKAPIGLTLSATQPLISVQFRNGQVTSVTGTAVPKAQVRQPPIGATRIKGVKCSVNFTDATTRVGSNTSVRWFGGVGCTGFLELFGQAFLQRSAQNVVALGSHYEGYIKSVASGNLASLVSGTSPSLYIRHLMNAAYPNPGGTGSLNVYPSAGQSINGATVCTLSIPKGMGPGVECDLYSNRF